MLNANINNPPVINQLFAVSRFSVDYIDGFFIVSELATAVSKHNTLQEANMVKSMLEH